MMTHKFKNTLAFISLSVALVACGNDDPIITDWKLKPAVLNSGNALRFVEKFWADMIYDILVGGRSPDQSEVPVAHLGYSGAFIVSSMMKHLPLHTAHARSFVDSVVCKNAGRVTYSGLVDDTTLTGVVKVTYEQCLEDGVELDGEATATIHQYDLTRDEIKSATTTITEMSVISGTASRLLTGTMKADKDFTTGKVTYVSNMLHKNMTGEGGETLSRDLKLVALNGGLTADGTFCINADGCATVKTPTTLVLGTTSVFPTTGVLTFTGVLGSSVRMDSAAAATTVSVDPEGDGTYVRVVQ